MLWQEALKTELIDFNIAITIVCTLRDYDLLKKHSPNDEEDRITISKCVSIILDASDRRAHKVLIRVLIRSFSN